MNFKDILKPKSDEEFDKIFDAIIELMIIGNKDFLTYIAQSSSFFISGGELFLKTDLIIKGVSYAIFQKGNLVTESLQNGWKKILKNKKFKKDFLDRVKETKWKEMWSEIMETMDKFSKS